MSECTHDCSSCSQDCGERDKTSMLEKPHAQSKIKKVIGIVQRKRRRRKINSFINTCRKHEQKGI